MKKTALSITLVALGGLSFSAVQADTVSFSFDNSLEITEISQSGDLDLFDGNLGDLTQVDLTISSSAQTIITLTNDSPQDQNARGESEVEMYFSISNGVALNPQPQMILGPMSTGLQSIVANGGTYASDLLTASDSDSTSYTSVADRASFTGVGTFSVDCFSLSSLTVVGGGGNVDATQDSDAQCGAMVTYTFDPPQSTGVPTPAPLVLMGLGLAAFLCEPSPQVV